MFRSIKNDRENYNLIRASSPAADADIETVLRFVSQNGRGLIFLSAEFRQNKEVVLSAMNQSVHALQHADNILLEDFDFMLEAVRRNGHAYEYASDELKNDRAFQEAAVAANGFAMLHIATTTSDYEIIQAKSFTKSDLQQHSLYSLGRTSPQQPEGADLFLTI